MQTAEADRIDWRRFCCLMDVECISSLSHRLKYVGPAYVRDELITRGDEVWQHLMARIRP